MEKLTFNSSIKATAAKVWQVLWNDATYRKWTSAFHEGSHAVSDWKEGSRIQFLGPDGSGMYSTIERSIPNGYIAFRHLGEVKNFVEQPNDEKSSAWSGAMETYSLKEENGSTELTVSVDMIDDPKMMDYFKAAFPKALDLLKELAENPVMLTVEATVAAPVDKVWKFWTLPEHITQWNNASDDWHTPHAENDLRVGGRFMARMEAKDGSFGFEFWGIYDEVKNNERIASTLGDGRKLKVEFAGNGSTTKVTESFEAEQTNSLELQQGGWQAILNNFKKYTEAN